MSPLCAMLFLLVLAPWFSHTITATDSDCLSIGYATCTQAEPSRNDSNVGQAKRTNRNGGRSHTKQHCLLIYHVVQRKSFGFPSAQAQAHFPECSNQYGD